MNLKKITVVIILGVIIGLSQHVFAEDFDVKLNSIYGDKITLGANELDEFIDAFETHLMEKNNDNPMAVEDILMAWDKMISIIERHMRADLPVSQKTLSVSVEMPLKFSDAYLEGHVLEKNYDTAMDYWMRGWKNALEAAKRVPIGNEREKLLSAVSRAFFKITQQIMQE